MTSKKRNNSLKEKPSVQYMELLDIIAEIIALDFLKTIEENKGEKSHV